MVAMQYIFVVNLIRRHFTIDHAADSDVPLKSFLLARTISRGNNFEVINR